MRRDLIFSVIFHVFVVGALYASGEIIPGHKIDLGEVVRVSLVSLPDMPPSMQPPTDPLSVPKAVKTETPPEPVPDAGAKAINAAPKKKEPPKAKVKKPYQSKATSGDQDQAGSENGNTDIAQGSGSPFAGATVDNASFNYPYWFNQVFYKINTNWRNPIDADGAIVCVVYFQVLKSGRVIETKVQKSSGIPAFDQACANAVELSSPFPPFPKEFSDEILGITIPFKYQP
jgi:TonB family protein